MSDEKTGGPAYPTCNEANVNGTMGMTLLDHFAGLAMQGHWANADGDSTLDWMDANPELVDGQMNIVAKCAYGQAAAMIVERNRRMNENR